MEKRDLLALLEQVADGTVSPEKAALRFKDEPFEELGYAKVDHHRGIRQGVSEVIYGAGKTKEQIAGIVDAMLSRGQNRILITRLAPEAYEYLSVKHEVKYEKLSRVGIVGEMPEPDGVGKIVVATGGTSDIPVAGGCAYSRSTRK